MTDAVAHRGPDGCGYYWGPGPALGHRRLSIIDVEGGRQPMSNEDGSVWIVFNGEIYNSPELRLELLRRGHSFKTRSDTETIVHLYEELGERCFERLRGMFALAIWDSRNSRLVLARDRVGIKPLFYAFGPEGVVFGSELKCIRESGELPLTVDPTAIADLFAFFYIPGPKTLYKDVYSLQPGHHLTITPDNITARSYWDLTGNELELPDSEYEERLHALLHDSVRCHLLSDVPVGAFLSGGVDSTAVLALMSQMTAAPVTTCSIGFAEEGFSELPKARAVAAFLGTDHHEKTITPEPGLLARMVGYYDQPFPDHSSVPTYYVSKLARECSGKVALSGDGGDENFGGYSRYVRMLALQHMRRWIPDTCLRPFRAGRGDRLRRDLPTRVRRLFHRAAVGAREGYLQAITIADAQMRDRIFSPDLRHELKGYDPLTAFRDIYDRAPGADPVWRMFYLDLKTYLADDILTKVDRASMANSVEVRVPLLDHKVVELAFAMPVGLKIRGGERKFILRKVAGRHVPSKFLRGKKKGFCMPVARWIRGELRPWAEEVVFSQPALSAYLDAAGTMDLWRRFQNGSEHLADVIDVVLSLALFLSETRRTATPVTRFNGFPSEAVGTHDRLAS